MKLGKELLLKFIIVWIILTGIISYVAGGIVYAINIYWLENRKVSLLLIGVVAVVTLLICILGMKNQNLRRYISRIDKAYVQNKYQQFVDRYSINKTEICIVLLLMAGGFILRVIGYNWGLVGSWQPDECKLVNPAITMAERKVLYSDYYYYPAQFVSKFVAIILLPYSRIKGLELDINTMAEGYFVFRIVVAMLGTFTIYTAYLIGNYIKPRLGVIFAALVTIFPYYVCFSKQVTGDITAMFFLSLTLLFALRYLEKYERKYIVWMTMGAVMATLEKWHGAIGIGYIGIIMILNIRNRKKLFSDGIFALISFAGWMFLLAPNVVIHIKSAIIDGFINIAVYDDAIGEPYYILLKNYIGYGFNYIGGLIYILLIIIGLVYIIKERSKYNYVLLLGVLKTIILCFLNRQYSRWGQELYFTELLLASMGIYFLMHLISRYFKLLGYSGLAMVCLEFMIGTILVVVVATSSEQDTRMVQRRYCIDNGITPENCASQYYSGFSASSWCDKEFPNAAEKITDWNKYITDIDGELHRKNDIEYVVLNLSQYDSEYESTFTGRCEEVARYTAVCGDTFRIPMESNSQTLWDWKVMEQDIKLIKSIAAGNMIGDNLVVYYVGNLQTLAD